MGTPIDMAAALRLYSWIDFEVAMPSGNTSVHQAIRAFLKLKPPLPPVALSFKASGADLHPQSRDLRFSMEL